MKPSLTLKIGTQLTMTPQLQQAIRLLQLSALDLELEIRETIESNPMLELEEEFPDHTESLESAADVAEAEPGELDGVDTEFEQPMPEDLPVDSSWDDVYEPTLPTSSSSGPDDGWDPTQTNAAEETLKDYLVWQLDLTPMSDTDRLIGMAVIDAINPDGMLEADAEELLAALDPGLGVEADEIEAVVKRIQRFDPPGVGARTLGECLLLQLEMLPPDTPWREPTVELVRDHLDTLAARDFNRLKRDTQHSEEALTAITVLIQSLNPPRRNDAR
jgi:RNA polymerase sigma-54 factor